MPALRDIFRKNVRIQQDSLLKSGSLAARQSLRSASGQAQRGPRGSARNQAHAAKSEPREYEPVHGQPSIHIVNQQSYPSSHIHTHHANEVPGPLGVSNMAAQLDSLAQNLTDLSAPLSLSQHGGAAAEAVEKQLETLHTWESHEVSCASSDSDLDTPPSPQPHIIMQPSSSLPSAANSRQPTNLLNAKAGTSHPQPLPPPLSPGTIRATSVQPASLYNTQRDTGALQQATGTHSEQHPGSASGRSVAAQTTFRAMQSLISPSRTYLSVALGVLILGAVMGMIMPSQSAGQGGVVPLSWWGNNGVGAVGGAKQLLGWNGPRADKKRLAPIGSGNGRERPESSRRVNLVAVVPAGEPSPYKATWDEVMLHIAQRLEWNNPDFRLQVFMQGALQQADSDEYKRFMDAAKSAEILVGVQVTDPMAVKAVQSAVSSIPTHVFFDSASSLQNSAMLDGYAPQLQLEPIRTLLEQLPWTKASQAKKVNDILQELYKRHSSDDLLFVFLVLINEYITKVPEVANTAKGMDFEGIQCIGRHCSQQVVECLGDVNCKTALDCLQACSFNDQVCQYRCIVSYESKPLEQFSLCILQLHNCRNLRAEMPMRPDPAPMPSFRGQPLTHEAAEDMFIGWMGEKPYSWLVAGGKNPAYDYFPCQHQLYYKGKGKGVLWYEPVFKAITLDGRQVWRRRRYRVRRGKVPGTFFYSVLDNGVTSNEYWRILDCADDYSFCLFYYSGAASAAGLSYSGAVLATPDGKWPDQHTARIQSALEPAGIKMWELSRVDNSQCQGAPLEKTSPATPALAA